MPGCAKYLDEIDPTLMVDGPESVKLWLPSALPQSRDILCTPGLPLIEFRLRYAQAVDSLNHLRFLLCLVRGLRLQTLKHPSPTQKNTRSRSVFEGMEARITQVSARYRDARTALRHLHPSGGWTSFLRELKKEDISGPREEENMVSKSRPSKSQFIPSWIWLVQAPPTHPDLPGSVIPSSPPQPGAPASHLAPSSAAAPEKEVENYMMVDWAKAQERAKRFEEEVELCVEEMRRTLLFFSWSAAEWEQRAEYRASADNPPPEDVLQGLRAYALRRSAMFREMIKVFVTDWSACLRPKGLGTEWLAQYSDFVAVKSGWNRIPSIIPLHLVQPDAEPDDAALSDLDDALESADMMDVEQDVEAELHKSLVQIIAEE